MTADKEMEARKDCSYFNMEDIHKLQTMDLESGKELLSKSVAESNATHENKIKAFNMILNAQNVKQLMFAATNFLLAAEKLTVN